MSHPDFDKAAAHITEAAIRDLLVDVVNVASPTGKEAAMAEFFVERMKQSGMETNLQYVDEGRPNAVGHLRGAGTGTNLLFTGHMDTSYDGDEEHLVGAGFKAKAVVEDGWVWGLGANNMKSGLVAALVAMEALVKAGIKLAGDVSFGGVVGEIEKTSIEEFQGIKYSGYGIGSKHLVTHGVTADYAVLCEPTGLRISTANLGCMWARITVGGTVAHSAMSNRPGTVNAINVMHELQKDIMAWAKAYEQDDIYMGERPNVTIACVRGGDSWRLSRNPYSCSLYLDIRTVPGQNAEMIKRQLRKVLRDFAARSGTPEAELFMYVTDPATVISDDLPVVEVLGAAQKTIMGSRPVSIIRRPGADAVHFNAYGVPCVVFGPGGRTHPISAGRSMHAVGEHVLIEDVLTSSRIYLATALELCNREGALQRSDRGA